MALTNPNSVISVEKLSYFKGKLAKTDSAVAGQLVSAVSESGGIISVSRRGLAATDVKLEAVSSPDTQYAAQYKLVAGTTQLGDTINIPKDQFLKDAQLYKTKADVPTDKRDYPEGTQDSFFPAIRFEFQLASGTNPLWVSVKDLVDTYTGGNGINITNNTISFKNGIGLAPDSDGKINIIHDDSLTYITQGEIGVNVGTGLELSEIATGSGNKLNVKLDGTTLARGDNGIKVSSSYDATLEKVANKTTTINAAVASASDTKYPTEKAVRTELNKKQDTLSAGNGINSTSLASQTIAVQVDSSNANGLSVGTSGIAMAVATNSTAGTVKVSAAGGLMMVDDAIGIKVEDNQGLQLYEDGGIGIANNGVTEVKINTNAVTTGKIANDAVTADKVADDAGLSGDQLAAATDALRGGVILATDTDIDSIFNS